MKDHGKKKKVRQICWICDKSDCKVVNNREIPVGFVLNDDVCDYCHRRVHEPILIELNNDR